MPVCNAKPVWCSWGTSSYQTVCAARFGLQGEGLGLKLQAVALVLLTGFRLRGFVCEVWGCEWSSLELRV